MCVPVKNCWCSVTTAQLRQVSFCCDFWSSQRDQIVPVNTSIAIFQPYVWTTRFNAGARIRPPTHEPLSDSPIKETHWIHSTSLNIKVVLYHWRSTSSCQSIWRWGWFRGWSQGQLLPPSGVPGWGRASRGCARGEFEVFLFVTQYSLYLGMKAESVIPVKARRLPPKLTHLGISMVRNGSEEKK